MAHPSSCPRRGSCPEHHIVLWVENAEHVCWWQERLRPVLLTIQTSPTSARISLRFWNERLPDHVHELQVITSGDLPAHVQEQIKHSEGRATVHHFGDTEGLREGCVWEDVKALASYLESVLLDRSGQTLFGVPLEVYCRDSSRTGPGIGRYAEGNWQSVLPVLLGCTQQIDAFSITLFLRAGPGSTLGDYAEVCEWLDGRIPADCMAFVSVVPGSLVESASLLLVTAPC